jgi:glycosyltransferase involved in cell wall biosynthesis
VSIVIRTFNEEVWLRDLLVSIAVQRVDCDVEVVVVDSESTDATVAIAAEQGATVVGIRKRDFTFGRSLNVGCERASGDILVFISGHCVPRDTMWLAELIAPLREGRSQLTYGRQEGGPRTKFSEQRIFAKQFPSGDDVTLLNFCNNANAALLRTTWAECGGFDESLTGLEDLDLALKAQAAGHKLEYVSAASVAHHHDETWSEVFRRYQREALAFGFILEPVGSVRCFVEYVAHLLGDVVAATASGRLGRIVEAVLFRTCQYWGQWRGSMEARRHLALVSGQRRALEPLT